MRKFIATTSIAAAASAFDLGFLDRKDFGRSSEDFGFAPTSSNSYKSKRPTTSRRSYRNNSYKKAERVRSNSYKKAEPVKKTNPHTPPSRPKNVKTYNNVKSYTTKEYAPFKSYDTRPKPYKARETREAKPYVKPYEAKPVKTYRNYKPYSPYKSNKPKEVKEAKRTYNNIESYKERRHSSNYEPEHPVYDNTPDEPEHPIYEPEPSIYDNTEPEHHPVYDNTPDEPDHPVYVNYQEPARHTGHDQHKDAHNYDAWALVAQDQNDKHGHLYDYGHLGDGHEH